MNKLHLDSQNPIAETMLIALYARAVETQRPDALLRDEQAVELVERIDYDYFRLKLNAGDQAETMLRVREFDRFTRDFLSRRAPAGVVHIGCGLDTRFSRVDDGNTLWFDLDLPEVIGLRRELIAESPRCRMLACSVFDPAWLEALRPYPERAFLFIAEGVFPYFDSASVKNLFLFLGEHFPGCELVCDGMTPFMIGLHNLKLSVSKLNARLHWGLAHPRDPETWAPGIRLLEAWYYFDRPEPRIERDRWMRHFAPFGKGVGIFHYRLGEAQAVRE